MKVRFSARAARELREIGSWIAERDREAAARFVTRLRDAARRIGAMPHAFPIMERYARLGIRHRVYGNYLILYRVEESQVTILHILHGARNYHSLLDIAPDAD